MPRTSQVLASLVAALLLAACNRSSDGPAAGSRDLTGYDLELYDGGAGKPGVCTLESAFTDCARRCWHADAALPGTGSPDWPCQPDPYCTDAGWVFDCK